MGRLRKNPGSVSRAMELAKKLGSLALFHGHPQYFYEDDIRDFRCKLSAFSDERKCALYLAMRSTSCVICYQNALRLWDGIHPGVPLEVEHPERLAPIVKIISGFMREGPREELLERFEFMAESRPKRAGKAPSPAVPPAPPREPVEVVYHEEPAPAAGQTTPEGRPAKVVRRRRKPRVEDVWVDVCEKCKKKKPIKAWGECHDCA